MIEIYQYSNTFLLIEFWGGEVFLSRVRVKDNAEWVISGRKTESAKRFVNIFLTVLALFFLFLLKTCVDVMNTPPSESQFMKACKGQMMTEERCKATEKRNRQFEKDMDEIFP